MEIILADTFFKRLKGLMGKKDFEDGMLFTNLTGSSIHTLFMRIERRFYKPKKHARYILETKKGKIKLEIGDHLDFI